MRKFFPFLFLFLCSFAAAQSTVTVTAHLKNPDGSASTSKNQLCFTLYDGSLSQPPVNPRVLGTGVLVPQQQCFKPDSVTGLVTAALYANDQISPANTVWGADFQYNGTSSSNFFYIFNLADVTENLDVKLPITSTPVVAAPGGDQIYARLDATNQPFTGPVQAKNFENTRYCTRFSGSDIGAQLTNCQTDLPAAGGVMDASGFVGALTSAGNIVLNKPVVLKLGPPGASLTVASGKQIQISSSGVAIQCAPGYTIIQGGAGTNLIATTGTFNDIRIDGCNLQGVAASGSASNNDAIHIVGGARHRIENNNITTFQLNPVYVENATDVIVMRNETYANSASIRFCGVQKGQITNNVVRDPQTPNATFVIAISVDSQSSSCPTAQNSRGITVSNNTVRNFVDAQAIDLHDCTNCAVVGNILDNVLTGIDVNPFAAPDVTTDISIAGNVITGTSTAGAVGSISNHCIGLAGGTGAQRVFHTSVTGNTCSNANAVVLSQSQGGIDIGNTDDATIEGNVIHGANGIGIVPNNPNTRLLIKGNTIMDVVPLPGSLQQVGIYGVAGVQTGRIEGNYVDNSGQGNTGTAYRFDVASSGLLFGANDATNVTNKIINPGNFTVQNYVTQFNWGCSGTATANTTLRLNTIRTGSFTCTDTGGFGVIPMSSAGTITNLNCLAGAGVNGSSGAVTVTKNASNQTLTCTIGTGTTCTDTSHTFGVVASDYLGITYTTQMGETLANLTCSLDKQ